LKKEKRGHLTSLSREEKTVVKGGWGKGEERGRHHIFLLAFYEGMVPSGGFGIGGGSQGGSLLECQAGKLWKKREPL